MKKLEIIAGSKEEVYEQLLPQIAALVENETELTANLANITAALKEAFGFLWVGFYLVKEDESLNQSLVLGPFQGPVACTRIPFGKGVCGTSWKEKRTLIVPDVEKFPGHIACSSLSKSEIVIPMITGDKVIGVLDIDSSSLNTFDQTDAVFLEKLLNDYLSTL